jgi:anti-anti-sigma factor
MTFRDSDKLATVGRSISRKDMPKVIVDLQALQFIDSAAVSMLIVLADRTRQVGGVLLVENPQGQVARVLSCIKFKDVLEQFCPAQHPDWDDGLLTGHADIDQQHKAMFARSLYIRNMDEGGGAASVESIGDILCHLADYAKDHFHLEETMMRAARYPFTEEHVVDHLIFFEKLTELTAMYEQGSADILHRCRGFVDQWLLAHNRVHDRKLADYLRPLPDQDRVSHDFGGAVVT